MTTGNKMVDLAAYVCENREWWNQGIGVSYETRENVEEIRWANIREAIYRMVKPCGKCIGVMAAEFFNCRRITTDIFVGKYRPYPGYPALKDFEILVDKLFYLQGIEAMQDYLLANSLHYRRFHNPNISSRDDLEAYLRKFCGAPNNCFGVKKWPEKCKPWDVFIEAGKLSGNSMFAG